MSHLPINPQIYISYPITDRKNHSSLCSHIAPFVHVHTHKKKNPLHISDFKETGLEVVEWIELVQTTGMWRIVEKMIINLRVSQNLLILYTKS
jgi:hypothetical protein